MKGLEISRAFYNEFGREMIESLFPLYKDKIAVGLVGSGSECLGFDDEFSRDHDFEPGFCLFIPDEDIIDRKTEFQLERAYLKLPKEFMGLKRGFVSPVGGNRHGVIRISDFYKNKLGKSDGNLSVGDFFSLPDYTLCEATNGEVFCDELGLFTSIREKVLNRPYDVSLKKLAGNILLMAQSGQYNFKRCIKRGDTAAAQLCAFEFTKAALYVIFILNNKYMPYYKWAFRAAREIENFNILDSLEFLISSDNLKKTANLKAEIIEDVSVALCDELKKRNLTDAICTDLEKHAYSVNDRIENSEIRNYNILCAV